AWAFFKRPAAGRYRGSPPGHRSGVIQPGRPEGSRKDRAPGLRRPRCAAGCVKNGAPRIAAECDYPTGILAGCLTAMTLDESYAYCERIARTQAKNFYYSFLLLSR